MTRSHSTSTGSDEIAAAVRAVHGELCEAMVFADGPALDAILDDGFTLTHMTGYVQPKAEWLQDIDTDRMRYHAIDNVEVAVAFEGATPVLTARTLTEATIWGGHGTWRLQLRTWFTPLGHTWVAGRTIASKW